MYIIGMSWKDKPTIISNFRKDNMYVFIDESGSIHDFGACCKAIKHRKPIELRDQTFALNAIIMDGRNLMRTKQSFSRLKLEFFNADDFHFHANEMGSSADGRYHKLGSYRLAALKHDINTILSNTHYYQNAVFCNKQHVFSDPNYLLNPKLAVEEIYKTLFQAIEKKLKKIGAKATLVIEGTSSPKLDNLILRFFLQQQSEHLLPHCCYCYFSTKASPSYPSGLEVADLTAAPIFSLAKYDYSLILHKHLSFPKLTDGDIISFSR